MELRKGEIHSQQQPNIQKSKEKKKQHLMSICVEAFSNATRIQDLPQVQPHRGKIQHEQFLHKSSTVRHISKG